MPKIRDLGINVIPETMRPPEIGGGGGKGGGSCEGATAKCDEGTACPSGTFQDTANCKDYAECTSGTFQNTANCKDYAECTSGTFHNTATCKDYRECPSGTFVPTQFCYQAPCTSGTFITTANCYDAQQCPSGTYRCGPGTYGPQCPGGTVPCTPGTMNCGHHTWATPDLTRMAAEQTGKPEAAGLTREAIEILKQQLHQQIAQLEEIARNLDPKTDETSGDK